MLLTLSTKNIRLSIDNIIINILTNKHFIRIHGSSIVNLNYIDGIKKMYNNTYEVKIQGVKDSVNMSRRYAKTILNKFQLLDTTYRIIIPLAEFLLNFQQISYILAKV